MRPTSRGRYCDACTQQVHDLSKLTEAEAKALLDSPADLCISYRSDAQGNVVFRPPVALVPVTRLRRSAAFAPAAGIALALAACTPHGESEVLPIEREVPALHQAAPVQIPETIPEAIDEPCELPPEADAVAEDPATDTTVEPEPTDEPSTPSMELVKGKRPLPKTRKLPPPRHRMGKPMRVNAFD